MQIQPKLYFSALAMDFHPVVMGYLTWGIYGEKSSKSTTSGGHVQHARDLRPSGMPTGCNRILENMRADRSHEIGPSCLLSCFLGCGH